VTSVERIAKIAGYSRGAGYSNFDGKEAIFLAVLEAQGQESLNNLLAAIGQASTPAAIVALRPDLQNASPRQRAHMLRSASDMAAAMAGSLVSNPPGALNEMKPVAASPRFSNVCGVPPGITT